ncbi:MAG: RDD family protein [Micrococcales bacterium]|nr:RDD family protein [Micrococcales bacterium]
MSRIGVPASIGRRTVALVWDLVLVLVPVLLVGLAAPPDGVVGGLLVVTLVLGVTLLQLYLQARYGWTVGKYLVDLRLVDRQTGEPIALGRLVPLGVDHEVVHLAAPVPEREDEGSLSDLAAPTMAMSIVPPSAVLPSAVSAGVVLPSAEPAGAGPMSGVTSDTPSPVLSSGLAPELERTRKAPPRADADWDDHEGLSPMSAELELSDGSAYEVAGVVLVGRNPTAGTGETALRLSEPQRSVSRTHLRMTVGPVAVWVEDAGSTNGSTVHLPDGSREECAYGQPVQVPVGSVIRIGDAWVRLCSVSGEPAFPERTIRR